jgi:hypothetical protein
MKLGSCEGRQLPRAPQAVVLDEAHEFERRIVRITDEISGKTIRISPPPRRSNSASSTESWTRSRADKAAHERGRHHFFGSLTGATPRVLAHCPVRQFVEGFCHGVCESGRR